MTDTSSAFIPSLDTTAAREFATDVNTRVTALEETVAALAAKVADISPSSLSNP